MSKPPVVRTLERSRSRYRSIATNEVALQQRYMVLASQAGVRAEAAIKQAELVSKAIEAMMTNEPG